MMRLLRYRVTDPPDLRYSALHVCGAGGAAWPV